MCSGTLKKTPDQMDHPLEALRAEWISRKHRFHRTLSTLYFPTRRTERAKTLARQKPCQALVLAEVSGPQISNVIQVRPGYIGVCSETIVLCRA